MHIKPTTGQIYMLPLRKVHFFMLKNGIPANNLLVGTGLIEADFSDPYHIITTIQARTYYLNAVSQGEEGAGLEIGYQTSLSDMGPRGLSEVTSATVRDAVDEALSSTPFYHLMGDWRVKYYGPSMINCITCDELDESLAIFFVERGIGTIQSHFEELCGPKTKPTRLLLNYPRPAYFERYQEIFCCPVLFDQPGIELHYPVRYLDHTIKTHDPHAQPALAAMTDTLQARLLSQSDLVTEVTQYLRRHKEKLPNLEQTAESFALSPRTLRRKLESCDTSFQVLLDAERRRLAEYFLLQTTQNINCIANRMGYNNSQNFSQAFKHWTGMSPREYRQSRS